MSETTSGCNRNDGTARRTVIVLGAVVGLLAGAAIWTSRSSPEATTCPERPAFEQVAGALSACLDADSIVGDAQRMLLEWGYVGPEWGGVGAADVLPGGGQEIIARFHADLENAAWSPQGRLIVLGRERRHWRVAFDAADLDIQKADGTPGTNWRYSILEAVDATGDGLEDLLVELLYSNGVHTVMSYVTLLTAHPGDDGSELRLAYLEDTTLTSPAYSFVDIGARTALQSVVAGKAVTRTFTFDGHSFVLAEERIDPSACKVSTMTPNGAQWCAFDDFDGLGGSPIYSPLLGLYRVKEGQVSHFDVQGTVRVLETAPNGDLYVGAGCGVLRHSLGEWETLAEVSCARSEFTGGLFPFDLAFAENGDIWVGGVHSLARFDGTAWEQYDIRARRILLAPDGSLWAEGWDGRAGGGCCFTHFTGDTWVTYTYATALPVSEDLLKRIRELRQ